MPVDVNMGGRPSNLSTIYSIGARVAGGGIGTIAFHNVLALHRNRLLQRLLCGSTRQTEIPSELVRSMGLANSAIRKAATFDSSRRLWHIQGILFDAWAARRLERAALLQVWSGSGLRCARAARELGMATVVTHASSHPLTQAQLLREEYARWGSEFRVLQSGQNRVLTELAEADNVLIPSDFVRDSFKEQGFPEQRLIQLPFGCDVGRFRPAERMSSVPFRVIFVGQLGIRKGLPVLMEAWKALKWKDAELWLVGRIEAGFKTLLSRWDGMTGLRRINYTPDPVALYQQAHVFAFPTIEEGSALVTYEALACGLPIITTPNAGSVARDGVEGFIIPIRDPDSLANRLERLRSDDRLRGKMSARARRRAEEFSWKRYARSYVRTISGLIGARQNET